MLKSRFAQEYRQMDIKATSMNRKPELFSNQSLAQRAIQ